MNSFGRYFPYFLRKLRGCKGMSSLLYPVLLLLLADLRELPFDVKEALEEMRPSFLFLF